MNYLDREGIFKALPVSWCVKTSEKTASVAISIQFAILAQLNGNEWDDWGGYAEHQCLGDFYIVKRDGSVNQGPVEQLAASLGWTGDLRVVAAEPPPQTIVQITVKADTYEGKTRYRAEWINPGDYIPQAAGASAESVGQLQTQFGSLLRAAAAGALAGRKDQKLAPPAPTTPPPSGPTHPNSTGGDDLPF